LGEYEVATTPIVSPFARARGRASGGEAVAVMSGD
jgi:hypothetical protein